MSNPSSDSYRNVTRYTGQDYSFAARYLRNRDPISPSMSPDIRPKEQQGYYPYASLWSTNPSGNLWALTQIVNNLGHWILMATGSSGPILNIAVPHGTSPVFPTNLGQVSFTSSGSSVVITGSTNAINYDVSGSKVVQTLTGDTGGAVSPTSGNINLSGAVTTYVTGTPSTSTLTTEVVSAANTFLLGAGPTTHSTTIGPLTNGQVIIGSTGVAPVAATLTAGENISIINGAGSITIAATNVSGGTGTANIGIAYSSGTFTVQGANGSALSASNPGYVTINSLSIPGRIVTIPIIANQTFTDHASGSSQLAGDSFGVTIQSGAYALDVPFFLYAVANSAQVMAGNIETAISFMISRFPNSSVSPVAGKIATSASSVASTQGSFYAMTGTAANYASSSALSIGSFRMQATSAIADWTVQTLNFNDGIGLGHFQEDNTFAMPTGAFGAASSSYFYANGGTAPQFSTVMHGYNIDMNNYVRLSTAFVNCTVAGAGAVTLQFALPYIVNGSSTGSAVVSSASNTVIGTSNVQPTGPNNKQIVYYNSNSTNLLTITNANVPMDASFAYGIGIQAQIIFTS